MNNLFYDLPENLQLEIIKMNPHPIADIYKQEMRKKWNEENTRLLNLYETRLHLLETRNDNLELCRELKRNHLSNYEKQNLIRTYTELFNEKIE